MVYKYIKRKFRRSVVSKVPRFLSMVFLVAPALACSVAQMSFSSDPVSEGTRCLTAGNSDKAAVFFRMAVAKNPQDADSHYLLGRAYMQSRDYVLANTEFQNCITLKPKSLSATYSRQCLSTMTTLLNSSQRPAKPPALDKIQQLDEMEAKAGGSSNAPHERRLDDQMAASLKNVASANDTSRAQKVRNYENFDEPTGNPIPLLASPKMESLQTRTSK